MVGDRRRRASSSTPAASSTTRTASQNSLGTINLVLASGRIGKPKSGYGTIVGQANGQGGREHGQKCDQLPGWRDISNPEHRRYIAGVWGIDEPELPGPGVDAYEMFRKIDRGEIKGLLSICFNPKVSLPDNAFITRCLEKLEFYAAIDFFLNDTAWHADIVLPGSLHEEDEGTVTQVEGRIIKINKAVDCPGEAREDWRIIQDIAQALGRPHGFTFSEPARDLRGAARRQQGRRRGLLGRHLREDRRSRLGVFWPCYSEDPRTGAPIDDHPGHAAAVRAGSYNPVAKGSGPFYFPDGRARFNVAEYRAAGRRCERRVPDLPDHRPGRQPVPVRHADAPHRAAGQAVPRAADRDASAAGGEARDRRRRLGDGRDAARDASRSRRRW